MNAKRAVTIHKTLVAQVVLASALFISQSVSATSSDQQSSPKKTSSKQLSVQEKSLARLMKLQVGEFDNYNQVNFLTNDFIESPQQPEDKYARLHVVKKTINSPHLQGHWLFSQINKVDRDGDIYRQIYTHFFIAPNGRITSKSYQLKDTSKKNQPVAHAFLNALTLKQLKPIFNGNGCDTLWRRELDQYVGLTNHQTCTIDSKYKDEKRLIFAEQIIGEKGYWGREGAYTSDGKLAFGLEAPNYYHYHRARSATCWVAVHLGDDKWEYYKDLNTHDQGGSLTFGKQAQYRLQLKQTEFIASNYADVFELFIYRGAEEKAFAYTWTEPAATRIGVNLREVQASCKISD